MFALHLKEDKGLFSDGEKKPTRHCINTQAGPSTGLNNLNFFKGPTALGGAQGAHREIFFFLVFKNEKMNTFGRGK